ncbi:MAG: hypothetical protein HY811_05830 [Planctomycetes bacterium]|nr:hypothetical protein [Planctomycetota bacterium]
MTTTKPKPIPLAMIICDSVIEDRITGKKSLIGIFNNIAVAQFPCQHPSINVFFTLTEGIGEYQGCLRCVKLDTNEIIININGPIPFPNRLATVEFNFELKNIRFPTEGQYVFELLCDDQPVISRKFNVSKIKTPEKKP